MAIKTVRAQINGSWHTLTYNSGTGKWEATITAPGATSFNQPGGYYNVTVEATNDAGTTGTADASAIHDLKLYVRERVAPVITILSPTNGAYLSNNQPTVIFTVVDEAGGSGVNLESIDVRVDAVQVPNEIGEVTPIENGYSFSYKSPVPLEDGLHIVTVDASDNDGNAADQKTVAVAIDTVPPVLNITSPAEGYITATASLNVSGTTNDVTSSPVTVAIELNNVDQGLVTVGVDGSFTKQITLVEGANTIVITATDAAGKSSSVTRNVTLDTSVPTVISASIAPNPVDAGKTMVISVVIE